MRSLNVLLCVLLALFTIVQYNDPDAILWVLIYGLPTIWAGFAAYRPSASAQPVAPGRVRAEHPRGRSGRDLMWPSEVSTSWDREKVREGLGLIITTVGLILVALTLWRTQHREVRRFAT